MNWTGGRRTKIQANAERMRQRQRFDRQRRLAMATSDQDLQQRSSIITDQGQRPPHSSLTARHRTFQSSNEKSGPLFVKKETDWGAATKTCDACQVRQQDPTNTITVFSPKTSLASGRSTQRDLSLMARDLNPGTMDYRTARLECLKILKSPSFDWLGEAYQLRPSELLERNITPPSQTSRNSRERVHQSSPAKRTDNGGRVHGVEDDDVGYSQSDSGADNESEDEDDEDEPLKIPEKHRAVCRELQTKRGKADIGVEEAINEPFEMSTDVHIIDNQSRIDPAEENVGHRSDMHPVRSSPRATDPPAVESASPAPPYIHSSTPLGHPMPVAVKTQVEAERSSHTRQSLSVAPGGVNQSQEPFIKDPREKENRRLETRDIEISSVPLPTTDAQATGPHAMEASPAIVDDTCPRPAEPFASVNTATTPRAARSPSLIVMSSTSHSTKNSVAIPHPTSAPVVEARAPESPASYALSAPRSTDSHSHSPHGSDNLLERRLDNSPGATSALETEQWPVEMYSQSVPSEMDAPLYSDDEETPYQSNTHNSSSTYKYNNSNNPDDHVDPYDISPEVSSQYTLSKQSSIVSTTFDWFPANQEQAARISLQEQERLSLQLQKQEQEQERPSQATLARSNSSNTHSVNISNNKNNNNNSSSSSRSSGICYDDYDFRDGSSSTSSSRRRSRGVHAQEQEQGRQHQHGSLIRLPSDPWDVDALGPILASQDDCGYDHRCGGVTGSGGAMQGLGSAFERGESMEGGEDDALSEWIHDDEW